ncbi:MAG TPA: type II toxin-antitoxin system RelE/ParE family toxin [Terriglobia bacterium]|nr:type II toxin-antitoxin system RelE/ParE family toxin [Terriglobia bacterium]
MAHRVAQRAEADLDDIWLYVAKESSSIEIANRLIDTITDRFFTLARFPYMGRSREEDFGPDTEAFPLENMSSCTVSKTRTCLSCASFTAGVS